MKKNNGFTLIELLATIIILAGIALVAFPILLNTIKNSEGKIDSATRKLVENAAKLYVDNNANDYPKTNGNTYCVAFDDLISSKHLEKGLLEAADIDYSNKVVKVTVTDNYDYEIVNSNECTVSLAKICTYKGTDVSKKYEYGAEYECDPGDGVLRTFYFLQNGDKTNWRKDNGERHIHSDSVGTAAAGEVSLIMSENIGEPIEWISSDDYNKANTDDTDCIFKSCNDEGPITVNNYLKQQTKDWTMVEVYLPTYAQLNLFAVDSSVAKMSWLYDNLDNDTGTTKPNGYWMSTVNGVVDTQVIGCTHLGLLRSFEVYGKYGVRPVITISKDEL